MKIVSSRMAQASQIKSSLAKQNDQPLIPFTSIKYQELQNQLAELTAERKLVMVRLQVAREMGDLSENGAYKYAKFELGDINRKMKDISFQLHNGYIVEKNDNTDIVEFGSTVTLEQDSDQGKKQFTYTLVSQYESDPQHGKLSQESPIGQAILGKKVGQTATVSTPRGVVIYTIILIS